MPKDNPNILVIGYPYTRGNYRAALAAIGAYFIVPKVWKIKKGKAEYRTQSNDHIVTTFSPFYHSDYPLIGGLLKGWMPMYPLLLWRMKRNHHIEVVFEAHEPILLTTVYHGIVTKLFGLKHVVFSWENISFDSKFSGLKGMIHRLILGTNLALADGVVCGNKKCMDIFQAITDKPLVHIPLAGLDPERFQFTGSRSGHTSVRFVFAGAIDYRKGLHILLPAFQKVQAVFPDARLTIIGSGTYENAIDQQISNLRLAVERLPWVDHDRLVQILTESDVFLYPSISYGGWEEQFGYSMAEASLMELPVIATHSGSIDEIVVDGVTGLLVAQADEHALADAMLALARDPGRRAKMGWAGRDMIVRRYANSVIGGKYLDFFKQIHE